MENGAMRLHLTREPGMTHAINACTSWSVNSSRQLRRGIAPGCR